MPILNSLDNFIVNFASDFFGAFIAVGGDQHFKLFIRPMGFGGDGEESFNLIG